MNFDLQLDYPVGYPFAVMEGTQLFFICEVGERIQVLHIKRSRTIEHLIKM